MATDKDTIYIDIDDEITGIIDKLIGSDGKVAALVLPKRAAVFQSIVNMKLLKRAADAHKKHLVLITSEAGLLPLAGAAGVHVAKTLTSKPEIPLAPSAIDDNDEETVQEDGSDTDPTPDPNAPIGQLAGGALAADGVETLVLDDDAPPPEADDVTPKTFDPPAKKNKKLAVPNFERFRLLLALGGLILLLGIGGLIFAMTALPKATITVKTDATTVDTSVLLNLATSKTTLDPTNNIVPAKLASLPKTYTQQVPTTGQKNNGNKASGSVTVTNCNDDPYTVAAGTGFSANGNTYISQDSVVIPGSTFSSPGSGSKCHNDGKAGVSIIAQSGGTSYNLPANTSYAIASKPSGISAVGGTISGGTDSIVQTVNQNDITSAKAKIVPNEAEAKQLLISQLQKDSLYAIAATYAAGTPAVTTSANVGDVATTVTVTETVTYTQFGVHKDDLRTLLKNNIKTQIDTDKQSILDDGLDADVFTVDNMTATDAKMTMTGKATAGPDIDANSIKAQAAGKKPGPLRDQLQNTPDVTSVDIKLSPFWVSTVPKKTERIKVVIAKPAVTAKASSSSGSQP